MDKESTTSLPLRSLKLFYLGKQDNANTILLKNSEGIRLVMP